MDGRLIEHHVEHALESRGHPTRNKDLSAKFRDMAGGILPPAGTTRSCR